MFFPACNKRTFRSRSPRNVSTLAACLLALLIIAVRPCSGQEADISDLVVSNSKEDLLVFFTVEHAFSEEMNEAVRNGLPMTFTFIIELYEQKKNWPDMKITDLTIDRVLRFDSLKEEYTVTEGSGEGRSLTVESLTEAKRLMSEINGFHLLPLSRLQPGGDFLLRVKAQLAKRELPFKMHYVIPFYSLWGFETEWHDLAFRY